MADTDTNGASHSPAPPAPSPEEEREARSMGWLPVDRFKGDPKNWVDAGEYVRRGREMLPLIRAENTRVKGELSNAQAKIAQQELQLAEMLESVEALKEAHAGMTRDAVERAKAALRKEIAAARRDGDVEGELDAQERLSALQAPPPPKKEEKKTPTPPPGPKVDPVLEAWKVDNPWYGTDARRTALAGAIAYEIRENPETAHLQGRAFYDKVAEEVGLAFAERKSSKVDGGRSNGTPPPPSSGSKGKTFDDLPAEAQAQCKKDEAKLVGEGKVFKTAKDWQAHYVREYFSDQAS